MNVPICVVDAFTAEKFRGNPAAVCVLPAAADAGWMQRVAAELNLSETAFIVPRPDGWGLRWFTPAVEVALCGHATLASAHVLWESGRVRDGERIDFHTEQSGTLTCRRLAGGIEMDFPARPASPAEAPAGLAEALGARPIWVGKSAYDYLAELESEEAVRSLTPDHVALGRLPVRGVIVTARGNGRSGYDFVSRFFAPGAGVTEDPVTGSAHCSLAPYWSAKLGRPALRAWQASARGGEVRVEVSGDRVRLAGQAVTAWRGVLL